MSKHEATGNSYNAHIDLVGLTFDVERDALNEDVWGCDVPQAALEIRKQEREEGARIAKEYELHSDRSELMSGLNDWALERAIKALRENDQESFENAWSVYEEAKADSVSFKQIAYEYRQEYWRRELRKVMSRKAIGFSRRNVSEPDEVGSVIELEDHRSGVTPTSEFPAAAAR